MKFRACLVLLLVLYPLFSHAGITTLLVKHTEGSCRTEISHDATPDEKTGVLIIRSYKTKTNLSTPCSPSKKQITDSLVAALNVYKQKGLKPVSSISLGRVFRYDWIKSYLDEHPPVYGKSHRLRHNTIFNTPYYLVDVLKPIRQALTEFKMDIESSRCEKLLIDKAGKVTDAMCWLKVEKLK